MLAPAWYPAITHVCGFSAVSAEVSTSCRILIEFVEEPQQSSRWQRDGEKNSVSNAITHFNVAFEGQITQVHSILKGVTWWNHSLCSSDQLYKYMHLVLFRIFSLVISGFCWFSPVWFCPCSPPSKNMRRALKTPSISWYIISQILMNTCTLITVSC